MEKKKPAPYAVPRNWRWVRLGEVAAWSSGGTPSRKHEEYYHGQIPWVKTGELKARYIYDTEEKITEAGLKNSSAKILPAGTVIIAMYGATIGKCSILRTEAATNQACACAVASQLTTPPFLYYFACAQQQNFVQMGQGGAQPNISQQKLKAYPFPLPPLPEQQRITAKLDRLLSRLDDAERKIAQVLAGSQDRRMAILQKAFTGELTAKWREQHNVGMESWKNVPLGDCGNWQGGGTPSKRHPEYWENGNILWITSKDMKSEEITDSQIHINSMGVENSSANYIEQPALLFVMRSGILRHTFPVAFVQCPFTVNQDLKAVLLRPEYNLKYMFYAVQAHGSHILAKCMKDGTTVESINSVALQNFTVPIATLPEQLELVRILDTLLVREKAILSAAEQALAQLKNLRSALLARAFRAQLGTNRPEESPAL